MKKFFCGLIIGIISSSIITAMAVEYAITPNPFPVTVNGVTVPIEGYNINDSSYFKLRDVVGALDGVDIGFTNNTITISTTQKEDDAMATVNNSKTPIPYQDIDGQKKLLVADANQYIWDLTDMEWGIDFTYSLDVSTCELVKQIDGGFRPIYEFDSEIIGAKKYISADVFEQEVLPRITGETK